MPYRVEPLDVSRHDRAGFLSASEALNTYLQQQARKDAERHLAATFVMVDEAAPGRIIGYYTLSNYTVELAELPQELTRKLPQYPRMPATLIGRLARDVSFPGKGELILVDALRRAFDHSKASGSLAVVAEAKDPNAVNFYRKYGFMQLGAAENRVYIPMGTVAKLCGGQR